MLSSLRNLQPIGATRRLPRVCIVTAIAMVLGVILPGTAPGQDAPESAPAIDPDAARIFHDTCSYLAQARGFCARAEIWEDAVLPNGQKIQTTRTVEAQERRPDQLHLEIHSPHASRGFWYRNRSLTILDRTKQLYGVVEVPENIDKMLDFVEDRLGLELPLADILVEDPYRSAMSQAVTAEYLGQATVLGVTCNHLAFTGRNVDWQIWVAEGPRPLPRKIVIDFKRRTGSPQVTAILSDWDLQSPISDSVFVFIPPAQAGRIGVNPRKPETAPAPDAAQPARK